MATNSTCSVEVMDEWYLGISAVITVAQQVFFFIIAAGFKFDKVTDFAGGTNFVVVALTTFFLAGTYHLRQLLVTIAATLWGLRLSGYLLYRIIKTGKDDRFDALDRGFSLAFAGFWFGQALWVMTVSLPVIFLNAECESDPSMHACDWIGLAMWLVGLSCEAVADQQKFNFRSNPDNKGKWCQSGLWAWSRHPNYFGEMLLWWGLFVTCSSIFGSGWLWVGLLSPVFITLLLLFASGIPTLEDSADKRYGSQPAYREFKASVSPLIPLPPSFYKSLPHGVKKLFFFEFDMYSRVSLRWLS